MQQNCIKSNKPVKTSHNWENIHKIEQGHKIVVNECYAIQFDLCYDSIGFDWIRFDSIRLDSIQRNPHYLATY